MTSALPQPRRTPVARRGAAARPHTAHRARLAGALAVLGLAIAPLGAQGTASGTIVSGQTWLWWQSAALPGAKFLHDDLCPAVSATLSIARACVHRGVQSSFAARVGAGGDLHVRSRALGTAASVGETFVDPAVHESMGLTATAGAYLWDELSFGSFVPAVVRFHFALDGHQALARPTLSAGTHATGLVSRARLYFGATQSATGVVPTPEFTVLEHGPYPVSPSERDVAWTGYADVALTGAGPLRFRIGSTTTATMSKPASGVQSFEGLVDTDFFSTAAFSLQLLDASGNDLTPGATVSSASGRAYRLGTDPTVATVPEPGTVALVGAGLLLLGAARRRRNDARRGRQGKEAPTGASRVRDERTGPTR